MCLLVLERRLNDPRWPKDAKQFEYVSRSDLPREYRMIRLTAGLNESSRVETVIFRRVGALADDIGRYMQEG